MNQGSLRAALQRLLVWRAVRPGSALLLVPTDTLEQTGHAMRVPTAIGSGLTLSRQARQWLEVSPAVTSETVVANTLYLQDAVPALTTAGYRNLRPGRGIFLVTTGPGGAPCPVLGRFTSGGYSGRRVREHVERLEPDLLSGRARLVVVHPDPTRLSYRHPQLQLLHVPPRWPS